MNTLRVLWSILWQRRCFHCGRHVRGHWGAPEIPLHSSDGRRSCPNNFAEWGPVDWYLLAGRVLVTVGVSCSVAGVVLILAGVLW